MHSHLVAIACLLLCSCQTPYLIQWTMKEDAIDASLASYCSYNEDQSDRKAMLERHGMRVRPQTDNQKVIGSSGSIVKCIQCTRRGDLIVAFTGTSSARDWVDNLNIVPWSYEGTLYHKGFLNRATDAERVLEADISGWRRAHPEKKIILTGHSLGGDIATILGIKLSKKGVKIDAVYTFGSPGCIFGDVRSVHTGYRQENYVNVHDQIPFLLGLLYSVNTGLPGYYYDVSSDGNVVLRESRWRSEPRRVNGTEGPQLVSGGISKILDHSMARYYNAMQKGDEVVARLINEIKKNKGTIKLVPPGSPEAKAMEIEIKNAIEAAGGLRATQPSS